MKFNKLVKIITEAGFRPSAPKNMGGNRIYQAKQSTGPAQYSSSSVGRNESPELRTPIERWEYNPEHGKDFGAAVGSKAYSAMLTGFGLLLNDEDFYKRFKKISETFGSRMQSYGHTKNKVNLDGELEKVAYDWESKLDNLEFMKNKRANQVTELNVKLAHYQKLVNDFNMPPGKRNELEIEYRALDSRVNTVEKQNKTKKDTVFFEIVKIFDRIDELDKLIISSNNEMSFTKSEDKKKKIQRTIDTYNTEIEKLNKKLTSTKRYQEETQRVEKYIKDRTRRDKLETKYNNTQVDKSTIEKAKAEIFDLNSKIEEMEKKYQDVVDELEGNYAYIDQINAVNKEANDDAVNEFIHLVTTTAQRLVNENKPTIAPMNSLQQLDWDKLPSNNAQKLEKLQALASNDPSINPMVGYLERFQRAYDDREYYSERELEKKVNISAIRNFESLPYSIMMKIYKAVGSKKIDLKAKEYDTSKDGVFDALKKYLTIFKSAKGDDIVDSYFDKVKDPEILEILLQLQGLKVRDLWANRIHKDLLKKLINDSGLPESFKTRHIINVASPKPFTVNSREFNSFMSLLSSIESDINNTKPKNESFDKIFEKVINEKVWDEDDFKLDTMEILSLLK